MLLCYGFICQSGIISTNSFSQAQCDFRLRFRFEKTYLYFLLESITDFEKMKEAVTEMPSKRIFTHQEDQLSGGDPPPEWFQTPPMGGAPGPETVQKKKFLPWFGSLGHNRSSHKWPYLVKPMESRSYDTQTDRRAKYGQ